MSCQILVGDNGVNEQAVFYCNTTDWAFGPVMSSREEAEGFMRYLEGDPRNYNDGELSKWYHRFVQESVCECGEVRRDKCTYCDFGEHLDENGQHHEEGEEPIPCELQPIPENDKRFVCERCAKKKKVAA